MPLIEFKRLLLTRVPDPFILQHIKSETEDFTNIDSMEDIVKICGSELKFLVNMNRYSFFLTNKVTKQRIDLEESGLITLNDLKATIADEAVDQISLEDINLRLYLK